MTCSFLLRIMVSVSTSNTWIRCSVYFSDCIIARPMPAQALAWPFVARSPTSIEGGSGPKARNKKEPRFTLLYQHTQLQNPLNMPVQTILLADDDAEDRAILKEAIEDISKETILEVAGNGEELLALLDLQYANG